ncbi:hypothetical protein J8273_5955 [Carpediemonas membranifera]|uniref:Uncharacterized protein n=1 Tax=Carpediemonas membranifera TaxID=201153 RepID=A0A8J6B9D1_9EUKA|nr:hypothetical protein J8273_5955 [Carpediemonas membranifera]|eukprot:KAG9392697.1 hypothetical protein J8273_5955 [Carpediemonas membranifera]
MPSKVKASVNKAIGEINGGDNNAPRRGNLEPGMRSFTQAKYTFTCLLACVSASAHALTPPRTVNLFDEEVLKQIVSIAQQKVSKAKAADRCRWIGDLAMWREALPEPKLIPFVPMAPVRPGFMTIDRGVTVLTPAMKRRLRVHVNWSATKNLTTEQVDRYERDHGDITKLRRLDSSILILRHNLQRLPGPGEGCFGGHLTRQQVTSCRAGRGFADVYVSVYKLSLRRQ